MGGRSTFGLSGAGAARPGATRSTPLCVPWCFLWRAPAAQLYGPDTLTWITVQINNGILSEDASNLQWCATHTSPTPAVCCSPLGVAVRSSPRRRRRSEAPARHISTQVHLRDVLVAHHGHHGGLWRHHR